MNIPDIILIHPPAIYDFRERGVLLGPISDVIPSTPLFEMYPIGFVSLSEYLTRNDLEARIINLANLMLKNPLMDVEKFISKLKTHAFGLDLHWLPHIQGTLAVAKLIKKHHPDTPIILGGFSASYFHEELLREYPQVDFIIRGDSTELPLTELLTAIKGEGDLSSIPNLSCRTEEGDICINEMDFVPEDIDYIDIDYSLMVRKASQYGDYTGYQPFADWYRYPITSVYSVRGCTHKCITCGGSASAMIINCERRKPAYRSPEMLVVDIKRISELFRSPIFIIGDLLQPGFDYFNEFIELLGKFNIENQIIYEFFTPPPDEVVELISYYTRNYNFEISMETHDDRIRRMFGRENFNNDGLERFIKTSLEQGCGRLDLFAMIGLSGQDTNSVYDTIDYLDYLLNTYTYGEGGLYPFISPLAPFVDPASSVFENPGEYGYKLFCKTAYEHKRAVEMAPSWKYLLNYETDWMTRDEIVESTYLSALQLNDVKLEHNLIDVAEAVRVGERIERAREIVSEVDVLVEEGGGVPDPDELVKMEENLREYNIATICGEGEWKWQLGGFPYKLLNILKEVWRGWWG